MHKKESLGPETRPDRGAVVDGALRIEVARPRPDAVLLTVHGEVDMITAPQLRECLEDELEPDTRVVLDISHCGFFSSSGIAALIHGVDLARQRGGEFRIVLPEDGGPIRRVLDAVGLLDHLPLRYSVDDALTPTG